jgi:hypothetical protein
MKIKAIVFGATGMVGEGVLHECINSSEVEEILMINRKSFEIKNSKVKELIIKNFEDFDLVKYDFSNYNACYFCMGVSSVGMNPDKYYHITYNLTLLIAKRLLRENKEMVFCYVSGTGTDSTEKGKIRWARVKGKTENELLNLGFNDAYMFRPGYIQPTKGLKNAYTFYKILSPLYPVIRILFSSTTCTLSELGKSMINVTKHSTTKKVLDNKDIQELGK